MKNPKPSPARAPCRAPLTLGAATDSIPSCCLTQGRYAARQAFAVYLRGYATCGEARREENRVKRQKSRKTIERCIRDRRNEAQFAGCSAVR